MMSGWLPEIPPSGKIIRALLETSGKISVLCEGSDQVTKKTS